MNIKQALKKKNKLVGLMSEEFGKMSKYNSINEGENRPYSTKDALDKWLDYSRELVELKIKIHVANQPVYSKIFTLSEKKNQIKLLKQLDCEEGKTAISRYGIDNTVIKTAEINVVLKDNLIKSIESQIEEIQDQLDAYNHVTLIED